MVPATNPPVPLLMAFVSAGKTRDVLLLWNCEFRCNFAETLLECLKNLYKEGGVVRLYQGIFPWGIMQNPLSRFGSVFANDLVIELATAWFPYIPVGVSTFAGSLFGALWRVFITPIDTCKTISQTDGPHGRVLLRSKMQRGGARVLWAGWEGNYVASLVGNYPWFATWNTLQAYLPVSDWYLFQLIRNAVIGAIASSVSDVVSNSVRVVKTMKQTHSSESVGYFDAAKEVIDKDGVVGLLGRGLETRIYTNVLQGVFFTVIWRSLAG